jgi:hypothetical protein
VPRSGAHGSDLAGADRLTATLVLGVSEGGEDNALLGGHGPSTLAARVDARNHGALRLLWSGGPATSAVANDRFGRAPPFDARVDVGVYIRSIIER